MAILKFLKSLFSKKKIIVNEPLSEDDFYKELFIKNKNWNTTTPNNDELKRWKIIKRYLNLINPKQKHLSILDLGCGRGWLTNLLSGYGEVLGIEPVESVVSYAKTLFPNLQFMVGSTPELITKNFENKFDVIVSSEVIEHIPDAHKIFFLKDIYRLLKPDGYCIITTPRQEIQDEWNAYKPPNQPVEDWISEEELRQLFVNNNFKSVAIERIALKAKTYDGYVDVYQAWLFKKIES